jgi:type IV pilus assembly protein PilM
MARVKTVWGIDIGQCALKAIKLADFGEFLQVVDFEVIEHAEILSQAEADKPLLIRQTLEQFLAGHNVSGSTIALAVPGQAASRDSSNPRQSSRRSFPASFNTKRPSRFPSPSTR